MGLRAHERDGRRAGIRTYVARDPAACAEVWWGRRLAAVRVRLDGVGADQLRELLADAWEGKAPKALRGAD